MSTEKGYFIVFEGIDGAGKTTQIGALAEALRRAGRQVAVTAEPTDSPSGRLLREALSGREKRTECEMAALFLWDRIYHNTGTGGIAALRAQGYDVICDRYYYSSLAYQGRSTDREWVKRMNLDCPQIARPDLCVFLDLAPEESIRRISAGRESVEIYEKQEILAAVREEFFNVFSDLEDKVAVIDTTGCSIDQVSEQVLTAVKKELGDLILS